MADPVADPAPPRGLPWLELAILAVATAWLALGGESIGGAAIGGCVLAAVAVAARTLLPREPASGAVAAIVLAVAPPLRDAVGHDAASLMLAAAAVGVPIAIGQWRGDRRLALAIAGGAGVLIVFAVTGALGPVPPLLPGAAAVIAESGRGAAAIVVAGGLLGAGFGALTGLPGARGLALAIAVAAIVGLVVPLLALLAIGVAIVPVAIVRGVGTTATGVRRQLIVVAAGLPLIAATAVTGAAIARTPPATIARPHAPSSPAPAPTATHLRTRVAPITARDRAAPRP